MLLNDVKRPNVKPAYIKAARSGQKKSSEFVNIGKWEGYTPPPMPKKKSRE